MDCIICDYNYAFDPRVYLRRFFDFGTAPNIFLIDEAHNLFDRAREYYSPFVSRRLAAQVGERVLQGEFRTSGMTDKERALFEDVGDHLARLATTIDRIARDAAEENPASIDGCRPIGRPVPA